MACPFFEPIEPLPSTGMIFPLGDPQRGVCRAIAGESFLSSDSQLTELCNYGYARGRCPRFPADAPADAVRFAVMRDEGGAIDLHYVIESGHRPFDHGALRYSVESGDLSPAPEPVVPQARAYIRSYLRRTSRI